MSNSSKYILLITTFFVALFSLFYAIDIFSKQALDLQKEILIQQAQTHFKDQVNTRKWNASYGGVYVKPHKGQKPNPYLKNNTLKVDENLTLIKINPAWMTRQLSEISNIKDFHFRIISLIPLNPNNKVSAFERRALEYIEKNNKKEYYEIKKDSSFNYVGALPTTKACMPCHKHQGYSIGDIRGGISITLSSNEYNNITTSIKKKSLIIKIFILLFLVCITILIDIQLKHNKKLSIEVFLRTREINQTKDLLQNVIDTDLSLMLVSSGTKTILVNQTLLNFLSVNSLDEFKKNYTHISEVFKHVDNEDYLYHHIEDEHWIDYLQREQKNRNLKVLIEINGEDRHLTVHSKEIILNEQKIHIIIFDDITDNLLQIKDLQNKATLDPLTKLFNRGKFNEVLAQEMQLAKTTSTPLCIIFLDIDFFKKVNDTYGHDAGDKVLITLANIISSTMRKGDFISRWGGEEFIITLQATSIEEASMVADKLRKIVNEYNFDIVKTVTISLGVTQYIEDEEESIFVKRVDDALYEAKESGRNKVIVK